MTPQAKVIVNNENKVEDSFALLFCCLNQSMIYSLVTDQRTK